MFFRNLTLFRFSAAAARGLDGLEAALAGQPLRPCGPLELFTRGFVSPLGGEEEALTRTLDGCSLFLLGQEDKLLPAAVVGAETQRRARELAEREGETLSARRRRALKQEVVEELLPRAFSKPSSTGAWLDRRDGWLVIDTAARTRAEVVVAALRDALGSFPALPLVPATPPRTLLTRWLTSGDLPPGLTLGDECELRDPGPAGGAVVRCQHQDLAGEEIAGHLHSGKQVARLGLDWNGRVRFVLGDDLVLRKLALTDIVLEELSWDEAATAAAEVDARFALMTGELRPLLEALGEWFGLVRPDAT